MTAVADFEEGVQLSIKLDKSAMEYRPVERSVFINELKRKRLKTSRPVTIVAKTIPRLYARHPIKKCPNPFEGNIYKLSRVNGFVNWEYEKAVNEQRIRENKSPTFESLPRTWGKRLKGTPLVSHEGFYYLEVKVEKSIEYRYYSLNKNVKIPTTTIEPYLVRSQSSRQGLDNPVVLRDYRIDHIVSVKLDGNGYILVGNSGTVRA
jgi:hypothetical protein